VALELQRAVLKLVHEIHGGTALDTPDWLMRPGRIDCGRRWTLVREIYAELTGLELPDTMPPRERRQVDLVLQKRGRAPRIIEVDERQHFNRFRATTLRAYPRSLRVAFPKRIWIDACERKSRLEGGGFGVAKPPLFPGQDGRHRQRAFRDMLADVLPPSHGWLPTLRIADFEVRDWINEPHGKARMRALLKERLS
jgi:hypothetical protein